jgi:hypothetical protein
MDRKSQWEFIETLAEKLGVSAEARRKWRERGVPGKFRLPIHRAALAAGVTIDDDVLDRPPRVDRRRAA